MELRIVVVIALLWFGFCMIGASFLAKDI